MTATLNPLVALDGTPDRRHSNGSIRGTAEQCPPVDSNHAPPGPEPGVLSAELDGHSCRAVPIRPAHVITAMITQGTKAAGAEQRRYRMKFSKRKIEDSNPRRPGGRRPGFRDQAHAHWCIPSMVRVGMFGHLTVQFGSYLPTRECRSPGVI